jgi:signal transduction histidine kinase
MELQMKENCNFIKTFWAKPPDSITREHQQSYFLSFYGGGLALALHFSWIFIFFKLGVHVLSVVNIFSTLIFVLAVYLARCRGMVLTMNILSSAEVLVHQAIAVHVLGWGFGFQQFYMTIPMYIFLTFHKKFIVPCITVAITTASYLGLYFYSQNVHSPLVQLDTSVEDVFYIFNTFVSILYIAIFGLIYNRAAFFAHRALEKETAVACANMRQAHQLLSIVCHDIANSNFVCGANVQFLINKNLLASEKAKRYASRIELGSRNIQEIIDSVRMLRAIEDGKKQLGLQPVEIKSILEKTRQTFLERLAQKNLELELEYPENEELRVLAEPVTLCNNVISNLVSNAIKFSYPSSKIRITTARQDRKVMISISDSGIGIPPEMVKKLFCFNEKTNRQGTAGEPGTGYGMPVVKSFVELYNGEIEVTSIPEESDKSRHGTTFHISLVAA